MIALDKDGNVLAESSDGFTWTQRAHGEFASIQMTAEEREMVATRRAEDDARLAEWHARNPSRITTLVLDANERYIIGMALDRGDDRE